MARVYRSFRVFVSSTFIDLVAERDALRRVVFPRLEEECRQRGARFQAVDLRWGVSEEAGRDHQTLAICLEELQRCRRESPRPNLLILLGNRYGWRPLPASVESSELESLLQVLPESDRERLTRWYRRDDNASPPAYVLLPREGKFENDAAWTAEEAELRRLLLRAMVLTGWSVAHPSRERYEASATHQEILHGALRLGFVDRQALCYFRHIDHLPRDGRAGAYLDPDTEAAERLTQLKAALKQGLPPEQVHEYRAHWSPRGLTGDHLPDLCQRVYADLKRIIEEELAGLKELSAFDVEVRAHEDFALERAAHFLGRETLRQRITDYLRGTDPRPLVLHGASGSGKTAVVSRAVLDCLESTTSATPVFRFLGATPASSEVRSLLENLCGQLATLYPDNQPVPGDFGELTQDFARRVALASAERPLLLFLDAADQLAAADGAHSLFWLPRPLPPNVRLVLSVLETDGPAGDCFRAAQGLYPPECLVPLEPLSPEHGSRLLDSWLADAKRALQPAQREEVLTRFAGCPRPLYLKLAFEEARRWKSFDPPFALRDDIPGVLHDLFGRLSRDSNHGAVLVERALAALAASRYGLTEEELLGALSADPDVMADFRRRSPESPESERLPWVVWSRLYHDLEPYLTERRADGAALLSFYHRQVGEAVAARFLSGDDAVRAHRRLAAFFAARPTYLRRADGVDVPDRRKASELAYQQVRGQMWDELEQTLAGNLDFLEAKCAAGQVFELAGDYAAAVLRMPADRPGRRVLRLLEEAVRTDIHFLARHPDALFQCLWNRAWWYDSPQAGAHYEAPADGWPAEGPPWSRPLLAPLLERWLVEKERRQPGFVWLRSLRPPDVHLGTPHRAVFRGHEDKVGGVAVSADGRVIVSGSDDRSVRVWEAAGGQPIALLRGHEGAVNSVACSADGRVIVSGSDDRTVRAWDADAGQVLAVMRGHTAEVSCVALSAAGGVVSGSNDTTVRLWNRAGWAEAAVLSGHRDKVTAVAVSPDGRRIASGSFDKTVIVWDSESGRAIATLRGHEGVVTSVEFSPDGLHVASGGTDKMVRIWEVETGRSLEVLSGHGDRVTCIAWTGDGRRVVSSSYDQTLRLWDIEGTQPAVVLRGHEAGVHSLACSADGRLIVSGSRDATVRVWDAHGGQSLARLRGHDEDITTLIWTARGDRLATGSDDTTTRLWDANALPGARLTWHARRVLHVAWSPDGRWLATASGDGLACVWTADGTGELKWLRGHAKEVCWVAFSPDGLRVATGSFDETVRIWDTVNATELACLRGHRDWVTNLAWSPDGKLLASGSRDGSVRLWDAATGKPGPVLQGHKGGIRGLAFSGDGNLIVSGAKDETVRVWQAATGRMATFLKGHRERIADVACSHDGRRVVSRSRDRITRIWDRESGITMEELPGITDVDALAIGPERLPWRAVAGALETAVELGSPGKAVAWFPLARGPHRDAPQRSGLGMLAWQSSDAVCSGRRVADESSGGAGYNSTRRAYHLRGNLPAVAHPVKLWSWPGAIDTPCPPVRIQFSPWMHSLRNHHQRKAVTVSAPVNEYEEQRAEKLRKIEELGLDPWGGRFDDHKPIQDVLALPGDLPEDQRQRVRIAGRIVSRRDGGKVHWLDVKDWSGKPTLREIKGEREGTTDKVPDLSSRVQVMIGQKQVGDVGWQLAQLLDLGDLIGVDGTYGKTRRGEPTVFAEGLTFLGKSLKNHPDKWGGAQDMEFRLRHRYLDLVYNPEVLDRARKRILIVRTIRRYLDDQGYFEVETPTLHAIAGGAAARPFVTHHNTLDVDLFLRIALELPLKRLLVGGIEKVYEIGRVFRNEGISPRHNPEFTMLELYQAYGDYRTMMDLTEGMVLASLDALEMGRQVQYGDATIDFTAPWKRARYPDLFREHVGVDMFDVPAVSAAAKRHGIEPANKDPDVVIHHLFEHVVEPHLVGPVFVYDYPAALCPLTKRSRTEPRVAERFELYIQKMELANAYTELSDPVTQEQTFRKQLVGLPDEDSMAKMDEDFITALRHGMPPAGGLGVGIDRLCMLLTNTQTIRDVILFPLLRPEKKE